MAVSERGFTLIEAVIVVFIIGIALSILYSAFNPPEAGNSPVRASQVQCVEGYAVLDGKQLLSETGAGVRCGG